MPAQSITPRATTGRSTSPLLGAPPNARVGTTTFTKSANGSVSRVRSVSSQRAVFTIVTSGTTRSDTADSLSNTARPGAVAEADAPPQVSLRSLSPAFQPLEPGVYSKVTTRAAVSRSASVVAAMAATEDVLPPSSTRTSLAPATSSAAPPGYNDALLKKSSTTAVVGVATRRSASKETGPLASSRQPLGIHGQRRAASSDAKPLPSKDQINSLRPNKHNATTAPPTSAVPQIPTKGVVAPRKRSADSLMPRAAAPPMNPSVQPRTYRRSLSTDAVPHMSRGASADRQPLTARQQHQPIVLNVVSSRGKSKDVHKVQQQALRPPVNQKVTTTVAAAHPAPATTSAAHRTASESGDAFPSTTTVPTATPSTQRNVAAAKLDYSDNEWSTPKEKPLGSEGCPPQHVSGVHDMQPIAIPDLAVVGDAVAVSEGEYDPSEADGQPEGKVTIPTLRLIETSVAPTVAATARHQSSAAIQQPIHAVQFDAPTVNFAARQRIAHNKSVIEERELDANKAAALTKRFNCADAISMQHKGRHFLNTNNAVGTCSRRSASGGGGKPVVVPSVSGRSGSASQYASRSVSPDISLQHVYRGRSIDDPHHNQTSHRSGSCNTTTNATTTATATAAAATRAQEIEDRLQRFSQQRQMSRQQLAVPVHHYSRPTESMQHESLRRNQLQSKNSGGVVVNDSSLILSSQGGSSPPSSPSKLMPLVSSKELNIKSFERSPDRTKELKTAQKTTFKRLLELGMEEDAKRASSINNNQHQEPKWVEDGAKQTLSSSMSASHGTAPPSLDRTQGAAAAPIPAVRHFEPFQRDTTTTSPLLSRRADSPRGARSGASFEDSMNSDGNTNNNNSVYLTTTTDVTATSFASGQPRISPDTYKDFEQQKAAKAVAEKKRVEEEQAAKRRQEAMHIAYARMKSPVPIPERAPARNLY